MDLLTIARRVKSETGRGGGGPLSVTSAVDNDLRIVNAVRDAWLDVQAEPYNWRWMRKNVAAGPLVAAQIAYTDAQLGLTAGAVASWWPESAQYRPTAYDAALSSQQWALVFMDYERFRQQFQVGTHTAGAPQFWSVDDAGRLLIGPMPDATVSYRVNIDYRQAPTELTADADEPDMPERFHRLLIWKALMDASTHDASQEHYVRARDRHEDIFNALIADQGEQITFGHRPLA